MRELALFILSTRARRCASLARASSFFGDKFRLDFLERCARTRLYSTALFYERAVRAAARCCCSVRRGFSGFLYCRGGEMLFFSFCWKRCIEWSTVDRV